MLDTKYEFVSAYLKSGEAKVITHDHINRLSRAGSFQDVLTSIIDTDVGKYLEEVPINTFDDIDKYLWGFLGKCIAQIGAFHFLPDDIGKVLRAYTVKYDLRNLKAALYRILIGKRTRMIPLGVIHDYGLLDELSDVENTGSIIDILSRCNLRDYIAALEESKIEAGAKPSLVTEAALDSVYYKHFLDTAKEVKNGFVLIKALGILIDLTNLQIVSRAIIEGVGMQAATGILTEGYLIPTKDIVDLLSLKLADIPGRLGNTAYRQVLEEVLNTHNKTQSITVVEETIDKYKFSMLKELLSPRVLSPLAVVWYLILKEVELRNLRLILKAIFDNISLEEIKPYLVVAL